MRRTKKQIFTIKCAETCEGGIGPLDLPFKTDIAVFIPLSDIQKRVYELFLEDYHKKEFRKEVEVNHIFPAILALKMLCVHPVLLLRKAFMDPDKKSKPVQQEEEDSPEQKEESDQELKESVDGDTQVTKNPQDGFVEELQK